MLILGDKTVKSMYLSNTKIKKAYLGNELVFESTPTKKRVGDSVVWAGYNWIAVNDNGDDTIVLACQDNCGTTVFADTNTNVYAGSVLAEKAAQFQKSLPQESLSKAVDTTVNGVTAKIFSASDGQAYGGFEYFKIKGQRVLTLNGTPVRWYTSSPGSKAGKVYSIATTGDHTSDWYNTICYFRPFVTILN